MLAIRFRLPVPAGSTVGDLRKSLLTSSLGR